MLLSKKKTNNTLIWATHFHLFIKPTKTYNAITKQLAMIVTRIVYSNGGHSIMKRVSRRNGWSSANRNSEVGPAGAGGVNGCVGTISTLTLWRDTVVILVEFLESWADIGGSCASWAASLHVYQFSIFNLIQIMIWSIKDKFSIFSPDKTHSNNFF